MRYRLLVFILLVSLTACSFQVQVVTPEPAAEVGTSITATLVTEHVDPGLRTATPEVPPTFTFTPVTITTTPVNAGTYSIRFAPNGTYIDIVDDISSGTSKTYSVSASKGQVMSVSVKQDLQGDWTYMPLQIAGADGTVLCPPVVNTECAFWRGTLPTTQDYLIKVIPVHSIQDFTLRVAINPPGAATQSFQYVSQNQRATFTYTDEFAPVRFHEADVYKIIPEIALSLIDTEAYLNTNLSEAYFLFGSSNAESIVQTCTQPVSFGGPEQVVGEVEINGVEFVHSDGGGVAAGNIYEQIYHRALHNSVCYEVTFLIHYGNIGAYVPDLGVKEFDRATLLQKFEAILSSLSLNP